MGKIGQKSREKLGLMPEVKDKPLMEGEDFTLFGIQKVKGKYVLVKLNFKNGQADKLTRTEPESGGVAIERFKIQTAELILNVLNGK